MSWVQVQVDVPNRARRWIALALWLALTVGAFRLPAPVVPFAVGVLAWLCGLVVGAFKQSVEHARDRADEPLHQHLAVARLWARNPSDAEELEAELAAINARRRWRPFTV